eukprot:scaffold41942_cov76-Phaeocystis_antarctica.AAC.3
MRPRTSAAVAGGMRRAWRGNRRAPLRWARSCGSGLPPRVGRSPCGPHAWCATTAAPRAGGNAAPSARRLWRSRSRRRGRVPRRRRARPTAALGSPRGACGPGRWAAARGWRRTAGGTYLPPRPT